jgi:hypothetical protein
MFPTHRRLAKVTATAKEIPPRIMRTITDAFLVTWALLEIFACNKFLLADYFKSTKKLTSKASISTTNVFKTKTSGPRTMA